MHSTQLPIPEPCHEDWDTMTGDERRRFCDRCRKHVHDLSAMTAAEAEDLVATEAGLCVQYAVLPDGEILHQPVARRALIAGAAAALLLAATPALAGGKPVVSEPPSAAAEVDLFESLRAWWAGERPTPMATEPDHPDMGTPDTIPELGAQSPPPEPVEVLRGEIATPPKVIRMLGKPAIRREGS